MMSFIFIDYNIMAINFANVDLLNAWGTGDYAL